MEAPPDRIAWLRSVLFADDAERPGPATHRVAGRFLVPIASRRVAAASVLAYNRLRPPRVAAVRAAVGAGLRVGAGEAVLRHEVRLAGSGDPSDDLVAHLAEVLGRPVHVAVGIGGSGPFMKPTLQLFADDGAPVGYAKVGWNDPTRAIVDREAAALGNPVLRAAVRMPELAASGPWRDRSLLVTAPLPAGVRRVPHRRRPCSDEAKAISGAAGTEQLRVGESRLAADARAAGEAAEVVDRLERYDDVVLPFGHAHGDWVPWNLCVDGGEVVAWDWEHHTEQAPLGFDLVHWAYQRWAVLKGRPSVEAAAAGAVDAAPWLHALGLSTREAGAVAAVHHATIAVREALAARAVATAT